MILDLVRRLRNLVGFYSLHQRSLASIRRWQNRKIRELSVYAAANVPLWKTIFFQYGIDPRKVRGLEDIRILPITNKRTYVGKVVEEYVDNSRPMRTFWKQTSGTSGEPFSFAGSWISNSDHASRFSRFRFMLWEGASITTLLRMRVAQIKIRAEGGSNRLFIPVPAFIADPQKTIAILSEFDPFVIETYASILLELARNIESQGTHAPMPHPRYIVSFGEKLSSKNRAYIEKILGAEVYDRYGTEEFGIVGCECRLHDGFHVNCESVVLEIIGDDGNPSPAGAYGRIIGTDLMNYYMPFIRYETGDHGTISFEPCACGLRTPRVWIEGRYSTYLTFNGKKIHHLELDGALDGFMNVIVQYQVVKKSDTALVVRVVPGEAFNEGSAREITASLSALVGEMVGVSIETVLSIPLTPRGKSQIVVDESPDPIKP